MKWLKRVYPSARDSAERPESPFGRPAPGPVGNGETAKKRTTAPNEASVHAVAIFESCFFKFIEYCKFFYICIFLMRFIVVYAHM